MPSKNDPSLANLKDASTDFSELKSVARQGLENNQHNLVLSTKKTLKHPDWQIHTITSLTFGIEESLTQIKVAIDFLFDSKSLINLVDHNQLSVSLASKPAADSNRPPEVIDIVTQALNPHTHGLVNSLEILEWTNEFDSKPDTSPIRNTYILDLLCQEDLVHFHFVPLLNHLINYQRTIDIALFNEHVWIGLSYLRHTDPVSLQFHWQDQDVTLHLNADFTHL